MKSLRKRRALAAAEAEKTKNLVNYGFDDENHDYVVYIAEVLVNRYKVKKTIGKGSFGQVLQALDRRTDQDVAIKVVKSKPLFSKQALVEVEILRHLNRMDKNGDQNVVRLIDTFIWRNHRVRYTDIYFHLCF